MRTRAADVRVDGKKILYMFASVPDRGPAAEARARARDGGHGSASDRASARPFGIAARRGCGKGADQATEKGPRRLRGQEVRASPCRLRAAAAPMPQRVPRE